ncbi:MAG: sugar nucleotide-binding protein [Acidimicrobiia bacterium]|nr:sugar nucleotide-binding protein [Acidimicrobiia bacterium]
MIGGAPERAGARPLVVTGASGYLARWLVPLAARRVPVLAVSRTRPEPAALGDATWAPLDVTDRAAVRELCEAVAPRAIVHTAAANPGADPALFGPVNVGAAAHVAEAATRVGARIVAVSTDTVHAGDAAPYADDAAASPINAYGESKAGGEAALGGADDVAIVRTSLIFGLEVMDRSTEGFRDRLASGERLELFADVVRQPIAAPALAQALVTLALDATDVVGTLNVAGRDVIDRARFGRRLLAHWNLGPAAQVVDVRAAGRRGVPLDLRLRLDRAEHLGLPTDGAAILAPTGPEGV